MSNLSEMFDDIYSNCDVLISSLRNQKDTSILSCEYDLNEFKSNFASYSKILSHEATKFAIAHSSPPFPELSATQNLAGSLCNAISQLVGCYLMLPYTCGSTFLQIIEKELESLVLGVKQFTETISNIILKNEVIQPCLLSTGILWEICDRLPSLPYNNKEAVTHILSREEQLIKDAVEELEQVDDEASDSGESDAENDSEIRGIALELLPSVKGLIKSAAALIRRAKKLINGFNGNDLTKIDPVAELCSTVSTIVDDLICTLYPPVNIGQAIEQGDLLSSKVNNILKAVQDIATEEDQHWIELLFKAVQHNLTNLKSKSSA